MITYVHPERLRINSRHRMGSTGLYSFEWTALEGAIAAAAESVPAKSLEECLQDFVLNIFSEGISRLAFAQNFEDKER